MWWTRSRTQEVDNLKIVREPDDIIPGKIYQYHSTVTRLEDAFFHLIWGKTMLHYLVGVEVVDARFPEGRCFVDLNTERGPWGVQIVPLDRLRHKIIYEVDDADGIGGRICRSSEDVVRLALIGTSELHYYRLLDSNCASFAFYCKLEGSSFDGNGTGPTIRADFGQRSNIRLVEVGY